jgi:hypothetical protein
MTLDVRGSDSNLPLCFNLLSFEAEGQYIAEV